MEDLRWGVAATGKIARKAVPLLARANRCVVAAVASSSIERARAFIDELELAAARPCTYDDLLAGDAHVDACYLATPNHRHFDMAASLLERRVHVLSEKPLTSRADQAERLASIARERTALLTEGFKFLHAKHHRALERIADDPAGPIGPLRHITASFVINLDERAPGNDRTSAAHHGGALMDLGCYPLAFARLIAKEEPAEWTARAILHDPHPGESLPVDALTLVRGAFPSGVTFDLRCALDRDALDHESLEIDPHPPIGATLAGDWGRCFTPCPFGSPPMPRSIDVDRSPDHPDGAGALSLPVGEDDDPFVHQFAEFTAAALRADHDAMRPSPHWSINQARWIGAILDRVGVRFDH
ncbi:MAG: Gfo/Idh/MocA family oxidoreductase [Planctomycetota bacterium]